MGEDALFTTQNGKANENTSLLIPEQIIHYFQLLHVPSAEPEKGWKCVVLKEFFLNSK